MDPKHVQKEYWEIPSYECGVEWIMSDGIMRDQILGRIREKIVKCNYN